MRTAKLAAILFGVSLYMTSAMAGLSQIGYPFVLKMKFTQSGLGDVYPADKDVYGYSFWRDNKFYVAMMKNSQHTVEMGQTLSGETFCRLNFSEKDGVVNATAEMMPDSKVTCQFSGTPGDDSFALMMK